MIWTSTSSLGANSTLCCWKTSYLSNVKTVPSLTPSTPNALSQLRIPAGEVMPLRSQLRIQEEGAKQEVVFGKDVERPLSEFFSFLPNSFKLHDQVGYVVSSLVSVSKRFFNQDPLELLLTQSWFLLLFFHLFLHIHFNY